MTDPKLVALSWEIRKIAAAEAAAHAKIAAAEAAQRFETAALAAEARYKALEANHASQIRALGAAYDFRKAADAEVMIKLQKRVDTLEQALSKAAEVEFVKLLRDRVEQLEKEPRNIINVPPANPTPVQINVDAPKVTVENTVEAAPVSPTPVQVNVSPKIEAEVKMPTTPEQKRRVYVSRDKRTGAITSFDVSPQ